MVNPTVDPTPFCTDLSRQAEEPLYGTAVAAPIWLFLEYNEPWQAKATSDNQLPPPVQTWLAEQMSRPPLVGSRLQFIKRPGVSIEDGLSFFIGVADELAPSLYHFTLRRYDDLFRLPLAEIVGRESAYDPFLRKDPVYFICTNGKRDRCCARRGIVLYNTLTAVDPNAAWQTTHLGGHRFAATLITFPTGIAYGRVSPEDAPALTKATRRGQILLENMRGRTCYDRVTQTAEYFLRRETGRHDLTQFRHIATHHQPDQNAWLCEFHALATRETHQLRLHEGEPLTIQAGCTVAALKEAPQYTLTDHRTFSDEMGEW